MERIIAALALAASASAYLVVMVAGVTFAGIEQSGVRGLGLLLAIGGTLAFAAALFIALAPASRFRSRLQRTGAALATVLAVIPVAVLAGALFSFAGLPLNSPLPLLDWTLFGLATALAIGVIALVSIGWRRVTAGTPPQAERPSGAEPPSDRQAGEI